MDRDIQTKDILRQLTATIFYDGGEQAVEKTSDYLGRIFYQYTKQFMPDSYKYLDEHCFEITNVISQTAIKLTFYRLKKNGEIFQTMGNSTQWQSDMVDLVISFAEYVNKILSWPDIRQIIFRDDTKQFEWKQNS
ncbi:hypothetical protein IKF94_03675 [Candidatus Saccharibacteria bacterium]|nr:hypothetical protein [Candidatus Saccharibacteria bacterium]